MNPARLSPRGRILNAISASPKPEWQIAKELGITPQRVLTELINLEQAGLAKQVGCNWVPDSVRAPDSPKMAEAANSVWSFAREAA